jgi:ABC-type antimicrobial peptide transport system permease subunit
VANRTAEIGIRVALGAQPTQIRSLILGQVARLLLSGISAGVLLTFVVRKFLASLLYGVSIYNPMILAGTILLLLSATFLAALIPTRRALRVNPIEALRHE